MAEDEERRNVRFLNEAQAAERLGISKAMLARVRKEGRIRYVRISSLIRYREEDLEAFYDQSSQVEEPRRPEPDKTEFRIIRSGYRPRK